MPSPSNNLRRARPLLGTIVEIRARGDAQNLAAAVDAAFAAIERVQSLMSFHDPQSDLSRLNRDADRQPVVVDPQTWEVLAFARAVSIASDGVFDITVAPQLVAWAYLPHYLPAIATPLPRVRHIGFRGIHLLSDCSVYFSEPLMIDLGGIAKGYAVDRACAKLEENGIVDYVVNAGGDLRVGVAPEPIHVRHPSAPGEFVPVATLANAAVATSAAYFAAKQINGTTLHPLVNPKTGAPPAMSGSVSVLAKDCMTSDALTKVVAILGVDAGDILDQFSAQAFLLSGCGERKILPIEDGLDEPSERAKNSASDESNA
jgi:thiamine biosynthesis lipoprotein